MWEQVCVCQELHMHFVSITFTGTHTVMTIFLKSSLHLCVYDTVCNNDDIGCKIASYEHGIDLKWNKQTNEMSESKKKRALARDNINSTERNMRVRKKTLIIMYGIFGLCEYLRVYLANMIWWYEYFARFSRRNDTYQPEWLAESKAKNNNTNYQCKDKVVWLMRRTSYWLK